MAVRILFLTQWFPPEVGAPQSRIFDVALALRRRGHEITVLTGFPNYPDGVIPPRYRGRLVQAEEIEGLRVLRTAIYPAPNAGVGRRLLNHASFAVSCLASAPRTGRADAVVVETPPLFTAGAGVILARAKRARLVLNVADFWPEAAIQLGALDNRAAIAGARAIERFAYRHADAIAVGTPPMRRALLERGRPGHQVVVVPHGVDPGRFPLDPAATPVPGRVVYCGTVGMGHSIVTLLRAAGIVQRAGDGHEFVIVGDGAERAALQRRAVEWGLRTVTFAGRVPRDRLPGLLAGAQVAVATQRDLPYLADVLSTKVLEYMAAARPVVGAVSGWTAEVIERAGAGIVCRPEDPAALAQAITELTDDPSRARAMGLSGRRFVEAHLTRAVAADRLEHALESIGAAGRQGEAPG